MSLLNYCFLTWIQILQEMSTPDHRKGEFPSLLWSTESNAFVGNDAEVDVFLEFPCLLYDPVNVGNLISGSSAYSKPSLYIYKFSVHIPLKLSLKNFEHDLTSMQRLYSLVRLYRSLNILWHYPSSGLEWKLTFSSPVATAGFSKFADILSVALTGASFRILNSKAGIPGPPLAFFIVMLPEAHLTSHYRMSGSEVSDHTLMVIGSLRPLLYSSSVYFWHLFLMSSASVRHFPFLSFMVPILAQNVPLTSPIFLQRSLVFPTLTFPLFLCTVHLRPSYLSLLFSRLSLQLGIWFPFSLAYHLSSFLSHCEASSDNPFAFLRFFISGVVLLTSSCTVLQTIVPQALCLSDLIPWICLSLPLYYHKGFALAYTWMA